MRNISGETIVICTIIISFVFLFSFLIYIGTSNGLEKFKICVEQGHQYIENSCVPISKDFYDR